MKALEKSIENKSAGNENTEAETVFHVDEISGLLQADVMPSGTTEICVAWQANEAGCNPHACK